MDSVIESHFQVPQTILFFRARYTNHCFIKPTTLQGKKHNGCCTFYTSNTITLSSMCRTQDLLRRCPVTAGLDADVEST